MATDVFPMGDYVLEINTGTVALPAYTEVKGITDLSMTVTSTDKDGSTFSDIGYGKDVPVRKAYKVTAKGLLYVDPDNGDIDPGQDAINVLSGLNGPSSKGLFRVKMTAHTALTFAATVSGGTPYGSGGKDDLAGWGADLNVAGKPVEVALP